MTIDSTTKLLSAEIPVRAKRGPRMSSINFIRQFSRAYVALAGVGINEFICN